jgi:hypothetical protein
MAAPVPDIMDGYLYSILATGWIMDRSQFYGKETIFLFSSQHPDQF